MSHSQHNEAGHETPTWLIKSFMVASASFGILTFVFLLLSKFIDLTYSIDTVSEVARPLPAPPVHVSFAILLFIFLGAPIYMHRRHGWKAFFFTFGIETLFISTAFFSML